MTMDSVLTLGKQVTRWRTAQALSRSRLAHRVGVASSTVARVESGAIGPSAQRWLNLVDALDCSLAMRFASGRRRNRGGTTACPWPICCWTATPPRPPIGSSSGRKKWTGICMGAGTPETSIGSKAGWRTPRAASSPHASRSPRWTATPAHTGARQPGRAPATTRRSIGWRRPPPRPTWAARHGGPQGELLTAYYLASDASRACIVMQTLARHGSPRERTDVQSLPSAWVASRWAPGLVADLLSAPTTPNERTRDLVVRHRDSPVRGS